MAIDRQHNINVARRPRSGLGRRLLIIAGVIVAFVIIFAVLYALGGSGH
jgi:hypothetical protein